MTFVSILQEVVHAYPHELSVIRYINQGVPTNRTSIGVTEREKNVCGLTKRLLERKLGRDLSWGEAVRYQAVLAKEHVQDCDPKVPEDWVNPDE